MFTNGHSATSRGAIRCHTSARVAAGIPPHLSQRSPAFGARSTRQAPSRVGACGLVAADHELLALAEAHLDPVAATHAGFVDRGDPIGDHAFEPGLTHDPLDLDGRAQRDNFASSDLVVVLLSGEARLARSRDPRAAVDRREPEEAATPRRAQRLAR